MSDRTKDLIIGMTLILVFTAFSVFAPGALLAIRFLLLFGLLFTGYLIGHRLAPDAGWFAGTLLGVIAVLAIQSIIQTIWFYAHGILGHWSDTWSFVGAAAFSHVVAWLIARPTSNTEGAREPWDFKRMMLATSVSAITLVCVGYPLIAAFRHATGDSIRTPWPLLPAGSIAAIAFTWVSIYLSLRLVRSRALAAIQSSLALFATVGIVPLLYRNGFGFDGFLHVAAEKLILANGTLNPQPLYYIGQYVFTTWMARIVDLPIAAVDRWLVPLAAIILLPLAIYLTINRSKPSYAPFFLWLVPLMPFIATTPQSFAYALGFTSLILASSRARIHPLLAILFGAWSIAVHPLAGVPLFCVTLALMFEQLKAHIRQHTLLSIASWLCILLSACIVPLLFFFVSRDGATPIHWNVGSIISAAPWANLLASITPWIGNHAVVWPAWSSLVAQALPFVLFLASVFTLTKQPSEKRQQWALLLGAGILLMIAATVLKTAGDFAFLIDYERGNYADRLNLLAIFCLFVAALPGLDELLQSTRQKHPLLQMGLIAGAVAMAAGFSYSALPRHDALVTGHGWSVGRADIDAIHLIDRDAAGTPYTVLANQSVSAAAVSELGFKRYAGDVFFYPIPTGGPLYDTFLRITADEPTRDTAAEAATLGQSALVYVVVNDYWWKADEVADALSIIANAEWTLGESDKGPGHIDHVYKIDLNKPVKANAAASGS